MPVSKSIGVQVSLGIAITLVALLLASRIWLIPAHFSTNSNEGWNAFQAARALGAGPLYPQPDALTGNNYPPLSFYIVGWAGRLTGDPIVAGRIIALTAVAAVAAAIFIAVRRFTGSASIAATVGVLMFLGFNATLFRSYVAMNDPQWLAHALMMAGLCVILPDRSGVAPGALNVVAGCLLMLLGGMVKHNLVAIPLATSLWLAWHHRQSFLIWAGTGVASLLVTAGLCYWAYGPDFFVDLITADRYYSRLRMVLKSAPVVLALIPLTVVAFGLLRFRKSDSRLDLLLIAVTISVPLGVLQRSGQGVNRNAHFEALIALCIAGAIALDRIGARSSKTLPNGLLPWLILPFIPLVPMTLWAEWKEVSGRQPAEASWQRMEQRIANTPGQVACQTPALCYWAGKQFEIDFFLYGQRVARTHDSTRLQHALDAHSFAAIEIGPKLPAARTGEVADPLGPIIDRRYRAIFVNDDGTRLLVPATTSSVAGQR